MAGWIVRATGDSDDPSKIRELLAELRAVLGKPGHGTGSSEFASAHVSASNFHEPDGQEQGEGSEPAPGKTGKPNGGKSAGGRSAAK